MGSLTFLLLVWEGRGTSVYAGAPFGERYASRSACRVNAHAHELLSPRLALEILGFPGTRDARELQREQNWAECVVALGEHARDISWAHTAESNQWFETVIRSNHNTHSEFLTYKTVDRQMVATSHRVSVKETFCAFVRFDRVCVRSTSDTMPLRVVASNAEM